MKLLQNPTILRDIFQCTFLNNLSFFAQHLSINMSSINFNESREDTSTRMQSLISIREQNIANNQSFLLNLMPERIIPAKEQVISEKVVINNTIGDQFREIIPEEYVFDKLIGRELELTILQNYLTLVRLSRNRHYILTFVHLNSIALDL